MKEQYSAFRASSAKLWILHPQSPVALSIQKSVMVLKTHISDHRSDSNGRHLWCSIFNKNIFASVVFKTGSVSWISEGTQENGCCQISVISKGQMWSLNLQRSSWCACFSLFFWHFAEWRCAHQLLEMGSHKMFLSPHTGNRKNIPPSKLAWPLCKRYHTS